MTTVIDPAESDALSVRPTEPRIADAKAVGTLAAEAHRRAVVVQSEVRQRAPLRPWWSVAPHIVTVVLVGALILVVNAWNITGYPGVSDDEGTYLAQAWAVRNGSGLAHYTYWYDHPPFGWIQLAGLSWLPSMLQPDALAVAAGRLAMLPVFAVTLGLVYTLALRIGLRRWTALFAMVLFGLSPLSVTLNRQIYLDSFAVAWILLAMFLAMSPRRHLWHHLAAGAATAVAVLSKETILLVVPAVVLALWRSTKGGPRAYSCAGFAAGLILVGLFYPIYALLKGELFPGPDHVSLLGAWQFQLADRGGSGWILTPGSPSNELLQAWLYYDQILPLAGAAATVIGLFVRRLRVPAVAAALLLLMALRPSGYLPAMYVIQVLPFLAILVAGVAESAVRAVVRLGPRTDPIAHRLGGAVLVAGAVLVGVALVPQWSGGLRHALVADDNARYVAAANWLRGRAAAEPGARVVLDDALWLDAVDAGFAQDRVIWFYKLDLDPAVAATLPHGWRDIDYVVSSPAIRAEPAGLPIVATLLQRSTVVITFGSGADRIEIRRIDKETS